MDGSGPQRLSAAEVSPCLVAARAGSTEALGQLLEMCRAYLLGVANRELESRLQAKAGASDMVQEAFLEAQRIFDRFDGESPEELLRWLRAILLYKLDHLTRHYAATDKRQVAREVPMDGDSAATPPTDLLADNLATPSSLVGREEQRQAVLQALERLPPDYRQVIEWRQWEDLPFEEIARRLDRSVDAARMLWWRAVKRLQQDLESAP